MATEALSPRPSRFAPGRTAATLRPRLGRWGLRGTALLYLGGMIALPLAAIVAKGYGRGTEALSSALASPGA